MQLKSARSAGECCDVSRQVFEAPECNVSGECAFQLIFSPWFGTNSEKNGRIEFTNMFIFYP